MRGGVPHACNYIRTYIVTNKDELCLCRSTQIYGEQLRQRVGFLHGELAAREYFHDQYGEGRGRRRRRLFEGRAAR